MTWRPCWYTITKEVIAKPFVKGTPTWLQWCHVNMPYNKIYFVLPYFHGGIFLQWVYEVKKRWCLILSFMLMSICEITHGQTADVTSEMMIVSSQSNVFNLSNCKAETWKTPGLAGIQFMSLNSSVGWSIGSSHHKGQGSSPSQTWLFSGCLLNLNTFDCKDHIFFCFSYSFLALVT